MSRDSSPKRKLSNSHCLPYKWREISQHPALRKVYTDDATDANTLPFAIRDELGDFLLEETTVKLTTLPEKKALYFKIVARLNRKPELKALWVRWIKLYFEPIQRTHTQHSIYLVIYVEMQNERKYASQLINK